jgi:hypothetical protein
LFKVHGCDPGIVPNLPRNRDAVPVFEGVNRPETGQTSRERRRTGKDSAPPGSRYFTGTLLASVGSEPSDQSTSAPVAARRMEVRLQRVSNRRRSADGSGPIRRLLILAAVFCVSFAAGSRPLLAAAEGEPLVARVSFTEGEVSYLNADAEEWAPVEVNAPLVTGDRFYSGDDGRAEIQLPGSLYARLSNGTEIDLLEVSDAAVQVRVGIGTATFRVREVPARMHVEISTPATAVVARSRGVYRIDVDRDGRTTVLVREGEADAYLGDERYRIDSGRAAEFMNVGYDDYDGGDPVRVFPAAEVQLDPWDDWEATRARRIEASASFQYVSDDVYGVEDLDEYGSWDRHETYGPVWRPTRVEAGWAPYTRGRWVWQNPWGWTWVDYQPWGWAPSHYGRWVYVQDYWAWAPGPIVTRPVYAPATVGFLGVSVNTPSVSVSVGIGPSVGWVPLGWGEPIIPWWGGVGGVTVGRPWWGGWGGPRIVNNTVINNTNITNINVENIRYANVDRPWGVTAVSRDSFVRGDFQRLDLPRDQIQNVVRPVRGAPDVIPQRESLFAARPERLRGGRAARPADDVLQRAAVTTRQLPSARPRFDQTRQAIERGKGAPVDPGELRRMGRDRAPLVRTVSATGRKAVTPESVASVDRSGSGREGIGGRGAGSPRDRSAPGSTLTTEDTTPRGGPGAKRDDVRGGERRRLGAQEGGETGPAASAERPSEPRDGGRAARGRATESPSGTERSSVERRGTPRSQAEAGPGQGEDSDRRRTGVGRSADGEKTGRTAREDGTPPKRDGATARSQREADPQQRSSMRNAQEPTERGGRASVTRQQPDGEKQRSAARNQQEQAERGRRESAARQQRETEQQQRQSMRNQQEQAERGRRESAARQQQEREQQQNAEKQRQSTRNQQQQVERGRRESAARQQQEREQQQNAEKQRQSMRNQQQQAERGRRESAARQQQERQQQQNAEKQRQSTRNQQQQVERGRRESAARQQQEREQQQNAEKQRQSMRNQQQAERGRREAAAREQQQVERNRQSANQRSTGREQQARQQRQPRQPEEQAAPQQQDRKRNDRRTQANARQNEERHQERGRRAL